MQSSRPRVCEFALAMIAFGASWAMADTIYVPADYGTIQEGIDAALDGDVVEVADGTYIGPGNRDLDFGGRLITVRSENGPESCIIDCEDSGRGFYFHSGETANAIVNGFTITNGALLNGGGLYCAASSPTVANCRFSGNSANSSGGGMYITTQSSPMVVNCTFSGNSAFHYAGGMYNHDSSPTVSNCTFSGNSANNEGGMLNRSGSSPTVTKCTFSGNTALLNGGALGNWINSHPTVVDCKFVQNSAGNCGGGMVNWTACEPTVTNCTFSGNSGGEGGGMYSTADCIPTLTDCILWGDSPDEIVGPAVVTHSDVQDGWDGEGNIDADPLFTPGPLGAYYLEHTAAGQDENSPCVNAGSDTAENLGLDDRTTRTDQVPDSGIVDMGYHYPIECLGDLDGDGDTDHSDLGILLADWGCVGSEPGDCPGDLDGDNDTDHSDLGILLADWGCGT